MIYVSELIVSFRIYGIPRPGGSKRGFLNRQTGRVQLVDANRNVGEWRAAVVSAALTAGIEAPLTGPLAIQVTFLMPRPSGHFGTGRNSELVKRSAPLGPISRPDTTKLMRSTEDALTGIIWRDDAQIVEQLVRKVWVSERPGAIIEIRRIVASHVDAVLAERNHAGFGRNPEFTSGS